MFSGIVEEAAPLLDIERDGGNVHLTLRCSFADELTIDQSLAHNGVCLTVVALDSEQHTYRVTAIQETLDRSNLGLLKPGDLVNLERSMRMDGRLDGHIVQGHVDCTATCTIIPYTLEHTNFRNIEVGTKVNIEFDIIGKYLARLAGFRR